MFKKLVNILPYSIVNFTADLITDKLGFALRVPDFLSYGKEFWLTFNFLQESQWWSRDKLEEYQLQQLRKVLHYAYETVPYYNRLFKKRHLLPGDIRYVSDLGKLPTLTKDTFKTCFNELVSRNVRTSTFPLNHTSGTTGKPLQFYQSYSEFEREWAFICHQWSRVGYKPGESLVELRGLPRPRKKNPIVHLTSSNVLRLSPVVEDKSGGQDYLNNIKSFGARFLNGYPSAIATFASIIRRYSLKVPFKLKAIFFSSEIVYDWQREIVEEVFNCPTFSHYGMAEHVTLAAECENNRFYHCVPQYGITEIDPDTNEIIGTNLYNYINPFIRYRTTDVASSSSFSKCEDCGRNYFPIFEKIEGRKEDFIVTPNGALVPPAVLTHPFKDLKYVKSAQLIQTVLDQIVLRVSLFEESGKSEKELMQLRANLIKILGEMEIEVEIVPEIEKTTAGKFKWVQSKISDGVIEKGLEKFE